MTYPIRLTRALFGAMIVTCALFLLMQSFIAMTDAIPEETEFFNISWVEVPEMTPVENRRKTAKKPPEPNIEPLPPSIELTAGETVTGWLSQEPVVTGPDIDIGASADGPYLPIVRVQPQYPRNALAKGIEGYTIVEFDVWIDGSVRNARVIEHHPGSLFDRASLQAVERFRYKPKIERGRPVVVTGVQSQFTFEIKRSN